MLQKIDNYFELTGKLIIIIIIIIIIIKKE
jgi:hypothetical protein